MHFAKILVLSSTFALVGLCLAQPAPVATPKKETAEEFFARYNKERKAKVITDFQKALHEKFKLSDADIIAVRFFITRQDAQLRIVQNALYQVTLAANEEANVSDKEYAVFWNDFQTLLTKYRAQKAEETAKLSEQLHLDQDLRLKLFLIMRGVVGDELTSITPMTQVFQDSDDLQEDLRKDIGPQRVIVPDEKA